MCSPRSRGAAVWPLAGLGALWLAAGCTDGVGRPFLALVDPDAYVADEGGTDAAAEGETDTGAQPTPILDASTPPVTRPKDGGTGTNTPKPQSLCDQLESGWSSQAARDADDLVRELNRLRANPSLMCSSAMPLPPLTRSAELDCAARLRLKDGDPIQAGGFSPEFRWVGRRDTQNFYERLDRAKFSETEAFAFELVISNATDVESISEAAASHADSLCVFLMASPAQLVGAARKDHVWIVDFAVTANAPPRPGRP